MSFGPKIDALRRSLVRYFGVPATSGGGEIPRTPAPGAFRPLEMSVSYSAADLQRYATPPAPAPETANLRESASRHPLAPEANPPPLDWAMWQRMAAENQVPGWAFCRFATRGPPPANHIGFVFGITRAPFGIHGEPFYLCDPVDAIEPVWGLTHLQSGFGCGLFSEREDAVAAAEIAARLAIDWSAFNPDDPDRTFAFLTLCRIHEAWGNAGITIAPFHAHPQDKNQPGIPVWFQDPETIERQRPEKLS